MAIYPNPFPAVHVEFAGHVVIVAVVNTVVVRAGVAAHTVIVTTLLLGPVTLRADWLPELLTMPVTLLNSVQVPEVSKVTARQATYWSQMARQPPSDWAVSALFATRLPLGGV